MFNRIEINIQNILISFIILYINFISVRYDLSFQNLALRCYIYIYILRNIWKYGNMQLSEQQKKVL